MIVFTCLKRILSILLVAWFSVACSTTIEVNNNSNNLETGLSGTIIVWQSFSRSELTESLISQYREVFDEYIGKFTQLYPQVKIITKLIEEEQLVAELGRELKKGLGPDLIYTRSIYILPLIKAKALLPLEEDALDLLQFRSEALDQFFYQNKIYGVPLDLSTQVLCYNKNRVKEPPKTLSELINQARAGYSVGILSNFSDAFWGTQIFGGQLLDDQGRVILDQGLGWVKWMEWLKNARNEPNFILNEDSILLQNAFIEERLVYHVCWSDKIPFLKESLGANKFGIALLPGEENGQAAPPLLVNGLLFSSVSSSNQTKISLLFAQFLANTEQQTALATQLRSFIPANREALIDLRLFPLQGILQKQTLSVTAFSLDETNKINAVRKYGRDLYKRVMAGAISPEQAVSQLTQTVNTQFKTP